MKASLGVWEQVAPPPESAAELSAQQYATGTWLAGPRSVGMGKTWLANSSRYAPFKPTLLLLSSTWTPARGGGGVAVWVSIGFYVLRCPPNDDPNLAHAVPRVVGRHPTLVIFSLTVAGLKTAKSVRADWGYPEIQDPNHWLEGTCTRKSSTGPKVQIDT